MVRIRIVVTQQATAPAAPAASDAPTSAQTRAEVRATLRQTLQDVQRTVQEGNPARVTVDGRGVIVTPRIAGTPGTIVVDPRGFDNVIPPQTVDIAVAFFVICAVMVIEWPIARAFGRRLERRGQTAALDAAATGQLQRIEQAVEAMAIEVERISESQRFMAKLQSDSAGRVHALPTMERR